MVANIKVGTIKNNKKVSYSLDSPYVEANNDSRIKPTPFETKLKTIIIIAVCL